MTAPTWVGVLVTWLVSSLSCRCPSVGPPPCRGSAGSSACPASCPSAWIHPVTKVKNPHQTQGALIVTANHCNDAHLGVIRPLSATSRF